MTVARAAITQGPLVFRISMHEGVYLPTCPWQYGDIRETLYYVNIFQFRIMQLPLSPTPFMLIVLRIS